MIPTLVYPHRRRGRAGIWRSIRLDRHPKTCSPRGRRLLWIIQSLIAYKSAAARYFWHGSRDLYQGKAQNEPNSLQKTSPASLPGPSDGSAADTDLQATISEVRPDGSELFVQTG